MMKILVTGATGFVGSHLIDHLLEQNQQVRCLIRNPSALKWLQAKKQIEIIKGDLQDMNALRDAVEQIDAVVHCAGLTKALDVKQYFHVNAIGTANLLKVVADHAPDIRRFTLISSLAAQGPENLGEANPVSCYGLSKLLGEKHALSYSSKIPITIIRPPVVYGPRDEALLPLFKSIKNRMMLLPMQGKISISIVYIDDLITAIMQSLSTSTPSGRIYYVEDGETYCWKDMLTTLAKMMGIRFVCRLPVPYPFIKASAMAAEFYGLMNKSTPLLTCDKSIEIRALKWICSANETKKDLNWIAHTKWNEGCELTYNWYKTMNKL